ncbi:unnamed protein product [Ixodes pacificus]
MLPKSQPSSCWFIEPLSEMRGKLCILWSFILHFFTSSAMWQCRWQLSRLYFIFLEQRLISRTPNQLLTDRKKKKRKRKRLYVYFLQG